ncbi:unnamed protein product, partial [Allacma fusca]
WSFLKTLKSARQNETQALLTSAIESDSDESQVTTRRIRTKPRIRQDISSEHEEEEQTDNFNPIPNLNGSFTSPLTTLFDFPNSFIQPPTDFNSSDVVQGASYQLLVTANKSVKLEKETQFNSKEFQELVLRKLAELKIQQDRVLTIISTGPAGDVDELDSLPDPCVTKEDISNLDKLLADDGQRKRLESYLVSIGGSTLQKTVNGILGHIVTDSLATVISYSGRGERAELGFGPRVDTRTTETQLKKKSTAQ